MVKGITKTAYADSNTIDHTYNAVGRLTYIDDSTAGPINIYMAIQAVPYVAAHWIRSFKR